MDEIRLHFKDDVLLQILRACRYRGKSGADGRDRDDLSTMIFATKGGRPMSPRNWRRIRRKRKSDRSGVPRTLTVHQRSNQTARLARQAWDQLLEQGRWDKRLIGW